MIDDGGGSVAGDSPSEMGDEVGCDVGEASSETEKEDAPMEAVADTTGVDNWPDTLCGRPLQFVAGRHDEHWSYHPRVRVTCANRAHIVCSKSRSVELCVAELGSRAPLLFLEAWLARSHSMPQARHMAWRPSISDMRAYM